jgi:hypothetical protein
MTETAASRRSPMIQVATYPTRSDSQGDAAYRR